MTMPRWTGSLASLYRTALAVCVSLVIGIVLLAESIPSHPLAVAPPTVLTRCDDLVPIQGTEDWNGIPIHVKSKVTGIEFVLVKPGVTMLGSKPGEGDEDETLHPCHLSAFYVSVFPVRNKEYEVFDPDHQPAAYSRTANQPVTMVDWNDAMRYATWVCQREGVSSNSYSIPSEAQMERAIRGDALALASKRYATGDEMPKKWTALSSSERAPEVDADDPVGFGIHGAVFGTFGWCADWYDPEYDLTLPGSVNPRGPPTGKKKSLRGGTWYIYGLSFRAADRWCALPDTRDPHVGMRLIRTIPGQPDPAPVAWIGRHVDGLTPPGDTNSSPQVVTLGDAQLLLLPGPTNLCIRIPLLPQEGSTFFVGQEFHFRIQSQDCGQITTSALATHAAYDTVGTRGLNANEHPQGTAPCPCGVLFTNGIPVSAVALTNIVADVVNLSQGCSASFRVAVEGFAFGLPSAEWSVKPKKAGTIGAFGGATSFLAASNYTGSATITAKGGTAERSVTIHIADYNINMTLAGLADANEEDPGGDLFVNRNDSDQNGVLDYLEAALSAADPDLKEITIHPVTFIAQKNKPAQTATNSSVKITYPASLKLWKDNTKTEPLPSGTGIPCNTLPVTLYAEGVGADPNARIVEHLDSCRNDTIKLAVHRVQADADSNNDGGVSGADDDVKLTAPGMLVSLNDDNDDGATEPDNAPEIDNANERLDGPDDRADLRPFVIRGFPSGTNALASATLTLKQVSGSGKIRVFKDDNDAGVVITGADGASAQDLVSSTKDGDLSLLVEGVELGPVTLELKGTVGGFTMTDKVLINVVKLAAYDKGDQLIDFGTAASDPFPVVHINPVALGSITTLQPGLVQVPVTGYVTDAIADSTESVEADITGVELSGQGISVTKEDDNDARSDPRRPFAKKYNFQTSVLMALANGDNQVTMSVTNALGNVGFGSFRVRAKIDLDETKMRDPGSAPPYLADSPLYLSLPASFNTNAVDTIGVGLQAPTLDAPLETINEDAVASLNFTGTTTNALGEVSVNFPSAPTLNPSTRDTIQATVTIPNLSLDAQTLTFVETDVNSDLFKLSEKKLRLRLASMASGSIQVAEDEDGVVGAYATLNQTAANTFEGTHPNLGVVQIVIQSGGAPNAAVQQEVLATVNAAGADIRQQAIAFEETGVATDEYLQEGIGHAVSGVSTGAGTNPFSVEIADVVVESPTDEGVSNPILFRYQSAAATNGMEKVVFEDRILDMKGDPNHDGWMVSKKPVFFVKSPPSQMISNVIANTDTTLALSITNAPAATPVSVEVASVITTASPRTKIPKGVNRVPLTLKSGRFSGLPDLDGEPSSISDVTVTPIRELSGNPDTKAQVDQIKHSQGSDQLQIWMTVSGDHSLAPSGRLIGFDVKTRKGKRFLIKESHEVVDLKVVILALDGAGYHALLSAVNSGDGFFSEHFSVGANKGVYNPGPVLNSLPTLTFVNWATWLTGQYPNEHGILGNAFFPRDLIGSDPLLGLPFGCANRKGINSSGFPVVSTVKLDVVAGAFDDKQNAEASEFEGLSSRLKRDALDKTALIYSDPALGRSVSVNGQYGSYSGDPLQDIHQVRHFSDIVDRVAVDRFLNLIRNNSTGQATTSDSKITLIRTLTEHGPDAAAKLDEETKKRALRIWSEGNPPNVQFLYFPGPDNEAHSPSNASQPAGTTMDPVIANHLTGQTGPAIGELWETIKKQGYEHAVLMVAIADHGLIRTPKSILTEQNVSGKENTGNIAHADEDDQLLAKVYESVTLQVASPDGILIEQNAELWRGGGTADLDEASLVHAPNGGMAHVYVRGVTQTSSGPSPTFANTWTIAPSPENLERLGEAIYSECTGIVTADHPEILYPEFQNALPTLGSYTSSGNPVVGLVMKRGGFSDVYKFFNPDSTDSPEPIFDDVGSFNPLGWVDAKNRLLAEMNDTNTPSRSGDLMLLMDTSQGVIAVNENDILPGWHGGATGAETNVPMFWSYRGSDGPDAAHRSDLIESVIKAQIDSAKQANGDVRTVDFRFFLLDALSRVRARQVTPP